MLITNTKHLVYFFVNDSHSSHFIFANVSDECIFTIIEKQEGSNHSGRYVGTF